MKVDLKSLPWATVRWRLSRSEAPTGQELARAIRSDEPIPEDLREYVAGRLEGSIPAPKQKRGRPKTTARMERVLAFWVLSEREAGLTKTEAIERIAEEFFMTPSAVAQAIRCRGAGGQAAFKKMIAELHEKMSKSK